MQHIVEQSNLYATQESPAKPLRLTCIKVEQFFVVIMMMSIFALLSSRLYWSLNMAILVISRIMSSTRFEQIKRYIHFNDNSSMLPPGNPNFDKLFKVRLLIEHFREKFNAIPMSRMLCIDKQMIPFKGNSSMKMYIPSKPYKYGYKVFILCNYQGLVHNFKLYSGKILPPDDTVDLGASSNSVLRLAKIIPINKNHLLYFDNWFTSLPLLYYLAKLKIFCLEIVRVNRLKGCDLPSDKEMKEKRRGSFVEKECNDDGICLRVVKWIDTKGVTIPTSFDSAHPLSSVKRYDKSAKSQIDVPCPKLVTTYNSFMGGVDLLDSLIALYRIKLRSKKYYHRIFFHFVDMVTVNCWLLYRQDCNGLGLSKKKQLSLLRFKISVAEALAKEGKSVTALKSGRPSTSVETQFQQKKGRGHNSKAIPQPAVRNDNFDHFPMSKEMRGRCKLPGCVKAVHIFFVKSAKCICA